MEMELGKDSGRGSFCGSQLTDDNRLCNWALRRLTTIKKAKRQYEMKKDRSPPTFGQSAGK